MAHIHIIFFILGSNTMETPLTSGPLATHHSDQVWKSWEALGAMDIQRFAAARACILEGAGGLETSGVP